jgi:hypothetical protein
MKKLHDMLGWSVHDESMGVAARAPRHELSGLMPGCDVLAALRSQIHQVHRLLEEQVGLAAKRTRTAPVAHSEVLSLYVHALCVEDTTVNVLLRKKPPLFEGVWIGGRLSPWDLTTLQGYAEVVYATTDVLLSRLTPTDLRSPIDLSDAGLGRPDVSWVVNRFVLWETAMICGEVAARPVARRYVAAHANDRSNGASADSHQQTLMQRMRKPLVPSSPPRSQ